MEIANLKQYILENDKIPTILEALQCHHIRNKGDYYSAANHDGDNFSAINVYKNENLNTVNYTRDILKGTNTACDIFTLVEYVKDCSFFEALKLVCEWIGIDYYYDFDEDMPESLKITKLILDMQGGGNTDLVEKPLTPIDENLLSYYKPWINEMFFKDGIDYETQRLFEIGYDENSNRITIPIRDELGTLVGIKGRLFQTDISDGEMKYVYLEPCAKSKILYGLHLSYSAIKKQRLVYVGESEKSVMQLYSMGITNSVATGGKTISKSQIEKLTRLCATIVFVYDKDVTQNELCDIANRFPEIVSLYAIIDKAQILNEKESPTDNQAKFKELKEKHIYKLR